MRRIIDIKVKDWVTNSKERGYTPYYNVIVIPSLNTTKILLFKRRYLDLRTAYTDFIINNLNVVKIIVQT